MNQTYCIRGYAEPHRTKDSQAVDYVYFHGSDSDMADFLDVGLGEFQRSN
jgi:hypothetical protein